MTKKLIALAVAAAFTAPMAAQAADVDFSGQVKVTAANVGGDTKDTKKSLAPSLDNWINIVAVEDLGSGLKAIGKHTIDLDGDKTSANETKSKDSYVGLQGGFGTVIAGRMETLTEGKISSMMDDGMSSHGANGQLETSLTGIGRVHALAYVSPSMNGVTIGVAGTLAGASGKTGEDDPAIHNTDFALMYKNGPISASASMLSISDVDDEFAVTTIGGSYKMDNMKFSLLHAMRDTDDDAADTMIRGDFTFGNNVLLVGHKSTSRKEDAQTTADDAVTVLKFTHKFSKTAGAWVGFRAKASDNADDVSHLGMYKKF